MTSVHDLTHDLSSEHGVTNGPGSLEKEDVMSAGEPTLERTQPGGLIACNAETKENQDEVTSRRFQEDNRNGEMK
jgi:hypothetical protein